MLINLVSLLPCLSVLHNLCLNMSIIALRTAASQLWQTSHSHDFHFCLNLCIQLHTFFTSMTSSEHTPSHGLVNINGIATKQMQEFPDKMLLLQWKKARFTAKCVCLLCYQQHSVTCMGLPFYARHVKQ
jgi:hypothetical protein